MTVTTRQLDPIGIEFVGADIGYLLEDTDAPTEIMDLLALNGVVLFRELNLDDSQQVAFARRLGEPVLKKTPGYAGEFPEVFTVSLDRSKNNVTYMKATVGWHIDGTTSTVKFPPMASILTARVLPDVGSQTEFASSYAVYDTLSEEEKERFESLEVCHSLEASYKRYDPNPSDEIVAELQGDENHVHPLVWIHRDGRKSLVVGTHAWYVEGMDRAEGAALLLDLEQRATKAGSVYSHDWSVGDCVIWDNRGVLHRAVEYEEDSGREMHRVTLTGDEPFQ